MFKVSILEAVNNIKEIFNINLGKIKNKIAYLNNHNIKFNNLDKCLSDEKKIINR